MAGESASPPAASLACTGPDLWSLGGCLTIETDGAPFDPTIHDAILQQPVPGVTAGTIVGTATKGYRLHDRVVRPAQVIVAKGE